MADPIVEKIKQTQNSFPKQNPGAVAECPIKQKPSENQTAPITSKTSYHLTQDMAKSMGTRGTAAEPAKEKKDWIEIILVDMEGKPVPNVRYRITPPGGDPPQEGRLNEHGQAGYYKIESGECKITFPDLDKDAWE